MSDEDREKGLYHKYDAKRVNDPTGKHKNDWLFVLDIRHDKIARAALSHYAHLAQKLGYGQLANDIHHKLDTIPYEAHE